MDLASLAKPQLIFSDVEAKSRDDALRTLTERICRVLGLSDSDAVLAALQEREELGSTAVGGGMAIPHGTDPRFAGHRAGCSGVEARCRLRRR